MTIFRRRVRSRPIRLFLITMFAVPLVSLVTLWAAIANITVRGAVTDHNFNASTRTITSAVQPLTIGLPAEGEASYLWLLSGRRSSEVPMLAARKLVNGAVPVAREAFGSLSSSSRSAANALLAQLGQLSSIRAAIDSGAISPLAAFQFYNGMIDAEFRLFDDSVQDRASSLAEITIGALDGAYAYEMASRETTLVAGALADGGQLSTAARQLFVGSAASRNLLMNQTLVFLTPSLRAGYLSIVNSAEYQKYQAMESQISASARSSAPIPVNAAAWQAASGAYLGSMEAAELNSSTALASMSASLSDRLVTEAVLAGGAGLLAVVVSVVLLVWFGRKVTRDLTRLDDSVRGMAQERLPRVVEQLRRGAEVDVLAESPPPRSSAIREVARIAESFAAVQRAAVAAAVDQARMRKGVSQVFLNISMRSQSLLHRQLGMLDSMERRTSDPRALADLFRLDHLTTRMRRHAEGLIILSGATPGRGWRDPVPVVDVLRAAVAEVEDYVRVDVVSESRDLVAGNVVNDVVHLTAELIENATVFSPPNTRIEVRAGRVGAGLAVEIEDRGLGLSAEEFADINRRLASPPEFDLADSEQLGLFVVGRLAARHNIKVSLRPSAYGGTTAILLLPFGVIVREEEIGAADDPPGWRLPAELEQSMQPEQTAQQARAALPPPPAAPQPAPQPAPEPASQPWDPSRMTPWSGAFEPAAARRPEPPSGPRADSVDGQPLLPASRAQAAGDGRPGPDAAGSHLGMPIRVPQASLAPQLRARRKAGWEMTADEVPEADDRPPEVIMNMMASMQQGWQRGRVDVLDDPQSAPGNGTD